MKKLTKEKSWSHYRKKGKLLFEYSLDGKVFVEKVENLSIRQLGNGVEVVPLQDDHVLVLLMDDDGEFCSDDIIEKSTLLRLINLSEDILKEEMGKAHYKLWRKLIDLGNPSKGIEGDIKESDDDDEVEDIIE